MSPSAKRALLCGSHELCATPRELECRTASAVSFMKGQGFTATPNEVKEIKAIPSSMRKV